MMLSMVRSRRSGQRGDPGAAVALGAVGVVYLLELAGVVALSLDLFHQTLDAVLSLPLALALAFWMAVCVSCDLAWRWAPAGEPHGARIVTSTLQWAGALLLALALTGAGTTVLTVLGATILFTIPC